MHIASFYLYTGRTPKAKKIRVSVQIEDEQYDEMVAEARRAHVPVTSWIKDSAMEKLSELTDLSNSTTQPEGALLRVCVEGAV